MIFVVSMRIISVKLAFSVENFPMRLRAGVVTARQGPPWETEFEASKRSPKSDPFRNGSPSRRPYIGGLYIGGVYIWAYIQGSI
jgi:hypothetical protein